MEKEKLTLNETVETLMKNLNLSLSTKSVVGEPITVKDATILPLADVQFGMGAGAFAKPGKNSGAGGVTGKISPSAVLVMKDGTTRVINIKDRDSVSRQLDIVPDIINKFTGKDEDPDVDAVVQDIKTSGDSDLI